VKYRAVIFDLFGTLVESPTFSGRESILREMAAVLSAPYAEFERQWSATNNDRDAGVLPDIRSSLEHVCRALAIRPTESQLLDATSIRLEYFRGLLKPRAGAVEALTKLKELKLKTGLISDCSIEVAMVWGLTPFDSLIGKRILSCLVGLKKPDPLIYAIAVENLGVRASECLFVGDGGSRELTGATRAGMGAVLIRPNGLNPDAYVIDREDWGGPSIGSLIEVLNLVD
jgi:putative hydrolase of the HAD superfamily